MSLEPRFSETRLWESPPNETILEIILDKFQSGGFKKK